MPSEAEASHQLLRAGSARNLISFDFAQDRLMKTYYVYIITNKWNTTLYIGMTNDLQKRMYEHKQKFVEGFSKKYNLNKLLYFEETSDVRIAIEREKQLKKWRRNKKIALIKKMNPKFEDLSEEWFGK